MHFRWGVTLVGKLSTGHCSPRRGTPFHVQVRCRRLNRIWDRMRDESWMRLCFVLFLSFIIFKQNQNMYTCLLYKRTVKWIVGKIVYHIFLYICELNMQEWVSIYETNECDIRTPDIYRFLQVEELSTGPPGWGCQILTSLIFFLGIPI